MGLFSRIAGIVGNFFQVGGPLGPAWKNNAGNLDARNAADAAFVNVRAATPLVDDDVATKAYVDTIFKPIPVSLQFNGNNPLPANTATKQYYVVTTTGPNASIGQVLWDDGSGIGTVTVLPAKTGNEIVTTANFLGGTITFVANQNYTWTGAAWVNISPNVAGQASVIDFAITNAASQSSVTSILANAIVLRCEVKITTPFSVGATIQVGQTGTPALLQGTADNFPAVAGEYDAPQRTAWGVAALPVLVTIGGAPAAGAGIVTVEYSNSPNP